MLSLNINHLENKEDSVNSKKWFPNLVILEKSLIIIMMYVSINIFSAWLFVVLPQLLLNFKTWRSCLTQLMNLIKRF